MGPPVAAISTNPQERLVIRKWRERIRCSPPLGNVPANGREQQPAHNTFRIDTLEVVELSNHLPGLVYNDDLVLLIGADPDIIVGVNHDPVRGVDAGDEDGRRAGGAIGIHRELDDLMIRGVGDEHDGALVVELDAVCAPNGEERNDPAAGLGANRGSLLH